MIEFPHLSPEQELWRYMSFTKLAAMLSTRAVFFARADTFEDIFEGAIAPIEKRDSIIGVMDGLSERIARSIVCQITGEEETASPKMSEALPSGKTYSLSITDEHEEAIRSWIKRDGPSVVIRTFGEMGNKAWREDFSGLFRKEYNYSFISCWHCASHESEAMWRLYSKETVEGIAIKTTAGQLIDILPKDRVFTTRRVLYNDSYIFDYHDPPLTRFFVKRRAFEHEKEVRVVLTDRAAGTREQCGVLVPVDLDKLLSMIVVSPYAPSWLAPVVSDLCLKFGIKAPVTPSQMVGKPMID